MGIYVKDKVAVPSSSAHKMGAAGTGSAIGTAIGVLLVAWLKLDGELALAVIGIANVAMASLGAYVQRNYLKNPEAAIRQIEEEMRKRPGPRKDRVVVRSPLFIGLLVVAFVVVLLLLNGCGERSRDILAEARAVGVATVIALNESGIDPLQVPEDKLYYVRIGCSVISTGAAVVMPTDPDLIFEAEDWCEIFLLAAGRAS